MHHRLAAICFHCILFAALSTHAQTNQPSTPAMSGIDVHSAQMSMPPASPATPMNMGMNMMEPPTTLIEAELSHTTSGTSVEPPSTPVSMLMRELSRLDAHAPRHRLHRRHPAASEESSRRRQTLLHQLDHAHGHAPARPTIRPTHATHHVLPRTRHITGRQYPELFQQGETAFGKPIIDGQHPHDFFMEVAALYDIHLSERTLLSFYAAPIGDPAIGPTAYPHRQSASEDPIGALGHHQQDSTHIAFNVLTGGLTWRWLRFEASGFHGAEPTEQRWGFQPSPNGLALDSYSSRVTFVPAANWTSQYSIAHITSPEALYPTEAQQRQTASIMYNRPIGVHHDTTSMPGMKMDTDMTTPATGNWSTTLLWGRTKSLTDNGIENSYLLESLLQFHTRNYVWTRIENAGRTNELLLPPGSALPPNFTESPIGHVAAYTFGYDRDYRFIPHSSPPPAHNSPPTPHPKPHLHIRPPSLGSSSLHPLPHRKITTVKSHTMFPDDRPQDRSHRYGRLLRLRRTTGRPTAARQTRRRRLARQPLRRLRRVL